MLCDILIAWLKRALTSGSKVPHFLKVSWSKVVIDIEQDQGRNLVDCFHFWDSSKLLSVFLCVLVAWYILVLISGSKVLHICQVFECKSVRKLAFGGLVFSDCEFPIPDQLNMESLYIYTSNSFQKDGRLIQSLNFYMILWIMLFWNFNFSDYKVL